MESTERPAAISGDRPAHAVFRDTGKRVRRPVVIVLAGVSMVARRSLD